MCVLSKRRIFSIYISNIHQVGFAVVSLLFVFGCIVCTCNYYPEVLSIRLLLGFYLRSFDGGTLIRQVGIWKGKMNVVILFSCARLDM